MLTLLLTLKLCEMETRKLSLQEMQMVESGDKLEIYCGVSNSLAIAALYILWSRRLV